MVMLQSSWTLPQPERWQHVRVRTFHCLTSSTSTEALLAEFSAVGIQQAPHLTLERVGWWCVSLLYDIWVRVIHCCVLHPHAGWHCSNSLSSPLCLPDLRVNVSTQLLIGLHHRLQRLAPVIHHVGGPGWAWPIVLFLPVLCPHRWESAMRCGEPWLGTGPKLAGLAVLGYTAGVLPQQRGGEWAGAPAADWPHPVAGSASTCGCRCGLHCHQAAGAEVRHGGQPCLVPAAHGDMVTGLAAVRQSESKQSTVTCNKCCHCTLVYCKQQNQLLIPCMVKTARPQLWDAGSSNGSCVHTMY